MFRLQVLLKDVARLTRKEYEVARAKIGEIGMELNAAFKSLGT
jgi:hypothetical protein